MKRILLSLLSLMLAFASWSQQVAYHIKGFCSPDVEKVYLIDKVSGMVTDSALAQAGHFAMKGQSETNALLSVAPQSGDVWEVLFFNDGVPVQVDLAQHTLVGSPLNEKLMIYDREDTKMLDFLRQLNEEFRNLSPQQRQARQLEFQIRAQQGVTNLRNFYANLLRENHDNLIPAVFATTIFELFDEEQLREAFDTIHVYARHPFALKVKAAHDSYAAMQKAREDAAQRILGKPFMDFDEPDMDGNLRKLSEYVGRGQWVLVDFWASWCGPCRAEMPNVVAAYHKYHERGFNIVGVSFDQDREAWLKAIVALKMPWPHLSDLKGWGNKAVEIYGIHSIPANLLIDPEGIIVARDLRGVALGNKLREIFGE